MIRSVKDQSREHEKAILVGVQTSKDTAWETEESLAELAELTRTAGGEVVKSLTQARPAPDSAFFIGKGKTLQLAGLVQELDAEVVILDCELSPAQQRNLENLLECKVIDRTQLILDIFAQRAESREGKIQVELAQLDYLLPRLTGRGSMMSRLGAGIGTRGPGETKLEADRRRIQDRIARLRREMDAVRSHRNVQRKRRMSREITSVAIVGYTNAGKSSLLNAIADAGALVEDKLFATLDPRTRSVNLEGGQTVVLTDTVGFIRRLPHSLVAAFRATLEEVTRADLILIVADCSHSYFEDHLRVVRQVLRDLDAANIPIITVLNKIDLLPDRLFPNKLMKQVPHSVAVSARTGENIHVLLRKVSAIVSSSRRVVELRIPQERGEVAAVVHEKGRVLDRKFENGSVVITAELEPRLIARLKEFVKEYR